LLTQEVTGVQTCALPIFTKINDKVVTNPKEAAELLEARKGRTKLEGVDVDGSRFIYVL
jgi:hypothetical protein